MAIRRKEDGRLIDTVKAVAVRRPDPAVLRPQANRGGPDYWPTPLSLCEVLAREILPMLPPGPIWEPAAGGGALVDAMRRAGRTVISTDIERDFISSAALTERLAGIITNPPFNELSAFARRGLELLDFGVTQALVLLHRHDHLQSESRTPPHCRLAAIERAALILCCPWRPRWIEGSTEAPRWTFSWVLWRRAAWGPPVFRYARPPLARQHELVLGSSFEPGAGSDPGIAAVSGGRC